MLLSSDSSNQETNWAGGKFYSLDRVILWKETGHFYIYQLPARAIRPVDHSDNSWTAEPSTCLYTFKTGPTEPCVVMYRQAMRPTHDIIIRGDPNGRFVSFIPDTSPVPTPSTSHPYFKPHLPPPYHTFPRQCYQVEYVVS